MCSSTNSQVAGSEQISVCVITFLFTFLLSLHILVAISIINKVCDKKHKGRLSNVNIPIPFTQHGDSPVPLLSTANYGEVPNNPKIKYGS